jgi:hypothetical protein
MANRAHSAENLPNKVMKSAFASEDPLTPSGHSEPMGLSGKNRRLRATLSSRFNLALPAFPETPFVAKDIAIEDSTCARSR